MTNADKADKADNGVDTVDTNPWLLLPHEPPYVLADDKKAVEEFNSDLGNSEHKHYLQIDKLVPEPFIGATDAPVLLLSNNPGFESDPKKLSHRQDERFRAMMRHNLHHTVAELPFVYLNPAFNMWETWWRRKRVRRLIKRFDQQLVARCILNVVLCPYPSRNYRKLPVPSQRYSFGLVRDAVARDAVIILMRPGKRKEWEANVKGLKGYKRFFSVPNPQNPAVTENLLDFEDCQRGFDETIEAIEAFAKTQKQSK